MVDVSMQVGLDADDVAAALWIHLDSCPISDVAFEDPYTWEMIADVLVNNGLGSTMTAAREATAYPAGSENPALAAWCKQRATELLTHRITGGVDAPVLAVAR
ncbi:MAG: hypothetical protein GEV07_16950 [Streptosporangiales bacterium]|nr:hypothetical protein [Streptosporangiales bacterium]